MTLKELRISCGLTQEETCKQAGLNQGNYSRLERLNTITISLAKKLTIPFKMEWYKIVDLIEEENEGGTKDA